MSTLFDQMEDEKTPTIGDEVGAALSAAVVDIGKQNDKMIAELGKAIASSISAVESKSIQINDSEPVQKWVFKIERNSSGLMTSITATAGTNQ